MQSSHDLLTPGERQELVCLRKELLDLPEEFSQIRCAVAKLSAFMALLKSKVDLSGIHPTDDADRLLINYLLEPRSTSGNEYARLMGFLKELTAETNLSPQKEKELIDNALDAYELFKEVKPQARLLSNTNLLFGVLGILQELNDPALQRLAEQMEQIQFTNTVDGFHGEKSLKVLQNLLVDLDITLAIAHARLYKTELALQNNDPVLLLLQYLLSKQEEREQLLAIFSTVKQAKSAVTKEHLEAFNKFKNSELHYVNLRLLSSKDQVELFEILYNLPQPDAQPAKAREQLARVLLLGVIDKFRNPRSLLEIKEQLAKCSWILALFDSSVSRDINLNSHELLIKYLSLSESKQEEFIIPLTTICCAKEFSIIRKQLTIFNEFKMTPIPDISPENFFSSYFSLNISQQEMLLDLIKKPIDPINKQINQCSLLITATKTSAELKSLHKTYLSLLEIIKLVESLTEYAIYLGIFIKPSLEKSLGKIKEKKSDMIELYTKKQNTLSIAASSETNKLEEKLKKLNAKQEKLLNSRLESSLTILENDLFVPIFENQLAALNENEIKHHLTSITSEKIKEIDTIESLAHYVAPLYHTWRFANLTILQAIEVALPLFKTIDTLIMPILQSRKVENAEADAFRNASRKIADTREKSEDSFENPFTFNKYILKKISDSALFVTNAGKGKRFLPEIKNHIDNIKSLLERVKQIQKRFKTLRLKESSISSIPEEPLHKRDKSRTVSLPKAGDVEMPINKHKPKVPSITTSNLSLTVVDDLPSPIKRQLAHKRLTQEERREEMAKHRGISVAKINFFKLKSENELNEDEPEEYKKQLSERTRRYTPPSSAH